MLFENTRLRMDKRIKSLEKYLNELEEFEAQILENDECWKSNSNYVFGITQKHMDRLMELQTKRNQLLGKHI